MEMTLLKPPRLREGDTVGLVAPASPLLSLNDIYRAERVLSRLGFTVRRGRYIRRRTGFLAGSDRERAEDLNSMFADPAVKGIFPLRGGYGSGRLLDLVDWEVIKANPKVIIGHSDLTALLISIYQRTGLVTFWGPLSGYDLGRNITPFKLRWLKAVVCKQKSPLQLPRGSRNWLVLGGCGKSAEGPLVGGNLSLLVSLMGTAYEIDTRGKLFFFEDVDEDPYKMDRMLNQLALAGKLSAASGIIVGRCLNCESSGRMRRSYRLRWVLEDRLAGLGIPVIYGAPIGHETNKITLPLGIRAILETEKPGLTLLEPAVS
jgi:muramoyltetrapeptide carboxypeptidase